MATEVIHSIGVGKDYSTVASWESAQQRDLVAADEIAVGEIYGQADVNYTTINDWTCDETRYCELRSAPGEKYDAVTKLGASINMPTTSYGLVAYTGSFIKLKDLLIKTSGNSTRPIIYKVEWNGVIIEECVIENILPLGGNSSKDVSIRNSVIIGYSSNISAVHRYCKLKNITIKVLAGQGSFDGQILIRNCECQNVAIYTENSFTNYSIFYTCTGDYNSQNNNGSAAPPGANSTLTLVQADFENYATGDFRLAAGSSLIGAGQDLSSDFTTDYFGNTRTLPWDIGAFKYSASGGGVTGSAAATESNTDSAIITGETGSAPSTGTLSAQENSIDLFQIDGELLVSGTLNSVETSTDNFTSTGNTQFAITGNISAVELATDNYLSSGDVIENGTLAATENSTDTCSTIGSVLINGLLSALEQNNDSAAISGASKVTGSLSVSEQNQDSTIFNGSILVSGDADMSETGIDSALINGTILVSGVLSAIEVSTDALIASGSGVSGGILSASESGTDTAFIQGLIYIQGGVAATEAQLDTASISGIVINSGNINAIEPFNDLFVAFGGPISTGSMLLTEPNTDLMLANGGSATLGNLSAQEQSIDDSAIAGEVIVSGFLPVVEPSIDSFLSIGKVISTGNLTAPEQETDSVEMGLTAEDFIDFVDTVYIKSQNNRVMVNNHNTEIYQR